MRFHELILAYYRGENSHYAPGSELKSLGLV